MKKITKLSGILALLGILLVLSSTSCSNNPPEHKHEQEPAEPTTENVSTPEESPAVEADPLKSKGIGPVSSLEIGEVNQELAAQGQTIFETKCAACHKLDAKYVGPSLGDVTKRRSPEWIVNMILNPVEMTQKDPTAQELLAEYLTQMTFQDISQDDAVAIHEYFRSHDEQSK